MSPIPEDAERFGDPWVWHAANGVDFLVTHKKACVGHYMAHEWHLLSIQAEHGRRSTSGSFMDSASAAVARCRLDFSAVH